MEFFYKFVWPMATIHPPVDAKAQLQTPPLKTFHPF